MTEEMKQQLRLVLNMVEERDLREYARKKGITLPNGATKRQVVEQLLESPPVELEDLLRSAVRLELRSTESSILNAIEEKAQSLESSLTTAFDENIKKELKGIDALRGLFTAVGAGPTLIVAALGVFSFMRLSNIEHSAQNLGELEKTMGERSKEVGELSQKTQRMLGVYRRYMIFQWMKDLSTAMDSFSSSLPDKKVFGQVRRNAQAIKELQDISPDSVDATALRRLSLLCNGLTVFEKLKQAEISEGDVVETLQEAEQEWTKIEILGESALGSDFTDFVKLTNAYRENVLGVIELKRFNQIAPVPDYLARAKEHFENSLSYNRNFGRPYSNLAVVFYRQFQLSRDPKEKERLLTRGEEYLSQAIACEQSGSSLSAVYNNIASITLTHARYFENENMLKEAGEKAENAARAIENAENQALVVPVVFISKAEIKSYQLYLAKLSGEDVSAASERLLEIMQLVKQGVRNGYKYTGKRGKEEFEWFLLLKEVDANSANEVFRTLQVK
jgi:hypothetical protein